MSKTMQAQCIKEFRKIPKGAVVNCKPLNGDKMEIQYKRRTRDKEQRSSHILPIQTFNEHFVLVMEAQAAMPLGMDASMPLAQPMIRVEGEDIAKAISEQFNINKDVFKY